MASTVMAGTVNSRRTHALTVSGFLVIVTAIASLLQTAPAAGQFQLLDHLDLVSQTLVVTDDPVVFDLRIPSQLANRQLKVRVHAPVTDPAELRAVFDDPPTENIISFFSLTNLRDHIGESGGVLSITLPDEQIGEIVRRKPGALPIVIEMVDESGIIDTLVTAVIVDDGQLGAAIHLGFLADGQSPLAHQLDQTIEIDIAATIARLADLESQRPGPTLIHFSPETLTALAHPETTGGLAAITTIAELLHRDDLYARPWVDLDEEAWRLAAETQRVLDQYRRGQTTLERLLGRSPTGVAALDRDATPETLSLLRSAGVTGTIVDAAQANSANLPVDANRPFRLLDANQVSMPALVVSATFESHLDHNDSELAASQTFAELSLLSDHVTQPLAFLVDLDTINRLALDQLLEHRALLPELRLSSAESLLALPPVRDELGRVLRVNLTAEAAPDISNSALDLHLTESILDSYASMVAPAVAPIVPLRSLLNVASSDQLNHEERQAFTNSVFVAVADRTAGFEVVSGGRITLATRTAELPLTLGNDQPLPITVVIRLSAEKIRFPDGDELTLSLESGVTVLAIPVETLASGDSRISVAVTSPDGRLNLASGAIDIRSTAISGLGLVVTLIALIVLASWWARTIRRVRRNRLAANLNPAPTTQGPPS